MEVKGSGLRDASLTLALTPFSLVVRPGQIVLPQWASGYGEGYDGYDVGLDLGFHWALPRLP